ncbi:MAG TPA: hypothetical protein VIH59_35145 [Candidatus Tectomicrobia bacterium]|jgi:hypothetical protein
MVEVQCNMSSGGQPELACSELIVVMVLQVFGNHTPQMMMK